MSAGWFKIWRSALDHHCFDQFDAFGMFVWMVGEAARDQREVFVRKLGKTITLERGQLWASTRDLAERCSSHKRARHILHHFQKNGILGTATGTGVTLITICNYDRYQALIDEGAQEGAHRGHTEGTPQGTQIRGEDSKGESKKVENLDPTESSTGVDPCREAIKIWNLELGDLLKKPRWPLAQDRRVTFRRRFKDDLGGSLDQWSALCRRIAASPFLTGDNDQGWRADFDWTLKPKNMRKILEGNYDARQPVERKSNQEGIVDVTNRVADRLRAARCDRDQPPLERDGQAERPEGRPRGPAIAVLPDGREVPIHGDPEGGDELDRGSPVVASGGEGFRGRATSSNGSCDAAIGEQERSMGQDPCVVAEGVERALGEIVRGTTSRPHDHRRGGWLEPASPDGATEPGDEYGSR